MRQRRRPPPRQRPMLEELEPRILFSAEAAAGLLDPSQWDGQAEVRLLEPAPSAAAPALAATAEQIRRHEIIFIDKQVPEWQALVDDLVSNNDGTRQVEIFLLDPNRDGVDQIGAVLAQRHDIGAVHLVSHGATGQVRLGSATLDGDALQTRAQQFRLWGEALSADADLLIYGCDVGAGGEGARFVARLAELTGADVVASDDKTGNEALGGDWTLEFQTGVIQAQVTFSAFGVPGWQGLLADPTLAWNTFQATNSIFRAVVVDASGNQFVGGNLGTDAAVWKLDSSGNLLWTKTLGGTDTDQIDGITLDASGNIYVTGFSGDTWGTPVRAFGGGMDAFVAKLNSSGTVTWNTFLGAGGNDYGYAIDVDGSGNVHVSGNSTASWGTPLRAYTSSADGFVAKLNSSGGLTWDTFLGGTGLDGLRGLTLDAGGSIFVAGFSDATWGTPVDAFSSGNDALAAKLTSAGALSWHSFFGGAGNDYAEGLVLDGSGNLILGGYSTATWGTPVGAYSNGNDALAIKVNGSGALVWNTFAGGSGADIAYDIAIDASDDVYLTGYSSATWGSPTRAYSAGEDAFAMELDSAGSRAWNTFLGGSGSDAGRAIATYGSSNVYVAGSSSATWGSPVLPFPGGISGFVAKLGVTTANTAPTLDTTKSSILTAQNEDSGAPSGAVGTLVSSLVDFASPAGQVDNVTDPDAGALLGIAVTAADTTNGSWHYSTNGGTNWNALGAVAGNNARLLAADANTRLYFQPNANYNGTLAAAVTFRAWDQTSGSNGAAADTTTNAGTTAFSTVTDAASLVIDAVVDIVVTPTSGLTTTEAGGTAQFTVVLDTAPSANVTIGISSSDTTEGTVSTGSLTFTTANWSSPRTVFVTGVDEDLVDGAQPLTIVVGTASSSDPKYNGIDAPDVSVANQDDPFERPPLGGETRVNTTIAGTQTLDASGRCVALDADGNYVVVWESAAQDGDQGGIYGQRFDSSGAAIGGEFRVNTTTTGNQTYASVAMDAAGNFLIVWNGNGPGDTDGVFAQRYDANGNKLGSEFRLNAAAAGVQSRPVAGACPTGGYVVVWSESDVLHMVQVAPTGALVNPTTLATAGTIDGSIDVDVADDGSCVVVWEEQATVQVACFEADGSLRYQTSVAAGMSFYDFDPSVATSANGEFGVAWAPYDFLVDSITYVCFQRFQLSDGAPVGASVAVASDVGGSPSLAMDDNGNAFVGYWSGSSIIKATLDATDAFVGAKRIVNTTVTGTRTLPSIVSDANGNQIAVWSGEGTGDTTGVFVQRYGTFTAPTNDAPVADDDGYSTDEDTPLVEPADGVLLNDADPDGDSITAVVVSGPSHAASFTLNADGSFSYTPVSNWNGSDSFTYNAYDGTDSSNTATVSITVNPLNDAPSFAIGDGITTTAIGSSHDQAQSVTVQTDGKILVAGFSSNGTNEDFALTRYNADGTLDTSFGGGDGIVTTAIGTGLDQAYSVTVQTDGKILVAGYSNNGTNDDFALTRYNADGTLDTSFGGGDGIVTTAIGPGLDRAYSVTVQTDGKILVAGESNSGAGDDFALVRYNADGTLDASFGGGDGIVTTAATVSAQQVTLQTDGKIVVAGYASGVGTYDFAVARYNSDGTLDTSFGGGDGIATVDIGAVSNQASSVAIQPDGKIAVGGSTSGTNWDFALVRLNADGTLDAGFGGGDGIVTTPIGATSSDFGRSVKVQTDGKIVLAGYGEATNDFVLVRYNADGSLDTGFGGGDGIVTTSIGASTEQAQSVTLLADGNIVVVGQTSNGGNNDFAVVCYKTDGSLDTSFGFATTLDGAPTFTENGAAVVLDANVQVFDAELSAVDNFNGATLTLARSGGANANDVYTATGTLGALTQGGNLVVGGTTIGTVTTNSGGTLVMTFNASATNALVNSAMQKIAYSNSSNTPPASAQINWTFNDGNTGSQGTGGALTAPGSVTVNITAVNDAPSATNLSAAETYTEDTPLNLTDIVISDVDSATVTATLTMSAPAAGSLNTGTSGTVTSTYDAGTGVWSASGAIADVNTLLAGLTFTPTLNYNSNFSIATSVSDGVAAPVTGSKAMTGIAVSDFPTNITLSNSSVSENVNTTSGYSVGSLTSTDPDGIDTFTYSIVGGADAGKFSIGGAGANVLILTDGLLNYEDQNSYAVTVRTNDNNGGTCDRAFTVTVNNLSGNISGIAYADQGVTNIGSGKTLNLVINGVSVESVVTGAGGVYSFTREAGAGDRVVIFIDNDATYKGATVTVANGGDIANIPVYASTLMLRNDNGGALSNADIATALGGYVDSDLQFSVAGGNLSASTANTRVLVAAAQTYTPGGNVSADSFEVLGTVNGGSNTFTVAANWNAGGGIFNAGTSTVLLNGSGTLNSASAFYNLITGAASQVTTLTGNLTVSGVLTIANSTGTLTDAGAGYDITVTGAGTPFVNNGATVTARKFIYSNANQVTISVAGGTYTVSSALQFDGRNTAGGTTFRLNGDLLVSGAGVIQVFPTMTGLAILDTSVLSHNITANELQVANGLFKAGFVYANNSTIDINGNVSFNSSVNTSINLGGSNWHVSGDWTNRSSVLTAGTSTVSFDGVSQRILGSTSFYNLTKVESIDDGIDSTLIFESAATQTITGTLTLDGLDADDRINLVSGTPGTQWRLNLTGTASKVIDSVEVTDSDASGSDPGQLTIEPANSLDGGNNTGWFSNSVPTTNAAGSGGNEDAAAITITLSGSDTDGTVDYFRLSSLPANGTLYTNVGLTIAAATATDYAATAEALSLYFVPNENWNGVTTFQYVAKDDAGAFDATAATATITVTAVNDVPVASVNTVSTNEDNAYIFSVVDFIYSDVESDALVSVTITNQNLAGGSLKLGAVTVNSGDTILAVDIPTLVYTPAANASGTGLASFDFTVNDADPGTVAAQMTIDVVPVNDAPTLGNGALAAVNEDTASPAGQAVSTIFSGQFSDPDAGSSFGGIAVVGNTANAGTQGSWQYSTNAGSNWFTIGTVADGATALALNSATLVRFVPVADYNGTLPALTVRGLDDTYAGGFSTTAGSETRITVDTTTNGGTTAIAAATANLATSITAVNDSPTVANGFVPTIDEDTADPPGQTIGNLFGGSFNDVDAGSSMSGILITNNPLNAAQGVWQYSTDSGSNWYDVGAIAYPASLALDVPALVRFVPTADYNGTASGLSLRALDDTYAGGFTSGASKVTSDASSPGGSSSISSSLVSITTTITAVNDAPARTAGTVANLTVPEDSGFTSLGLGGVAYGPGGGADESGQTLSYAVTAIPSGSVGNVYLADGTTLVTTGSYTLAQIQGMQFKTTADASGVTGFQYNVSDSGGTANGGSNSISEFLLITITAVNDAPSLSATALNPTFTEAAGPGTQAAAVSVFGSASASTIESGQTLSGLTFTVSGLVDGASEVIVVDGRTITLGATSSGTTVTNSLAYTSTVSGGAATIVLSGGTLSAAATQALVNAITYQNTNTDNPSAGNRVITLTQVKDGGGTTNGGADTTALSIASTVTVITLNDAPTTAPVTLAPMAEDSGARLITQADLLAGAADVDGDTLTAVSLARTSGSGSLTDNGDGTWTYIPALNDDTNVSFSYTISDGTASVAGSASLDISPVNDAPAVTSASLTVGEGQTVTLSDANIGTSDPDDVSVTYTLSGVSGGYFQLATATSTPIATFSEADLSGGTVQFVDDGNEAAPGFSVAVNDGTASSNTLAATITYTAGNDAPTFNVGDGIVTTSIGTFDDTANSMTVQPDGKILVAGVSYNGTNNDFTVVRYNADGTLDTTFSGDGVSTTAIGDGDDTAYGIAVQADGKILVAGSSFNGTNDDFAIVRYNTDGSLDTSFNTTGKVTTAIGTSHDNGYGVTVQADGKIVVAGHTSIGGVRQFALVRYDTNGSLDTSFNTTGKVTTDIGSGNDFGHSVTVQTDGKIVVAGTSNKYFAVARYQADGSPDTSFNGTGKVTTALGPALGSSASYGVTVQADGKILVAGFTDNLVDCDLAIVRYNTSGTLDTSFNGGGKATYDLGGSDFAYSIAVQTDGKILVAGQSDLGTGDYDFVLVRTNPDGAGDTTFSGSGVLTTAVGPDNDGGHSVAVQPDGRILVAGHSFNGVNNDFALVRYDSDGSMDASFGTVATLGGIVGYTEGDAAVRLDTDVQIFDAELSVVSFSGATLTLARNGGADAQDIFSATGNLAALTEGGNLVLSGVAIGTVTSNSAGTLVLSFNGNATEARVTETLRAIAYRNSSDTPPSSVQIDWTFSDGNTGAQGSGGALAATGTTTVSIAAVNDAPSGSTNTVTTSEDTAYTFTAADFGFSDPNDVPANSLLAVRIATLPAAGSLTLNGVAVTTGQTISAVDISNSLLRFTPAADANGTGYASFTFQVQDSGGTANGGVDLDPTPNTITIDVTAVDDPPVAADDRLSIAFDGIDDHVSVANSPSLVMGSTMTIEAWVNPDVSANTRQMILNKEGEYELAVFGDGSLNFAFAEGGAWTWRGTGATIAANTWTHVAITYNAGVVTTYVNGALVGSHTLSTTTIGDVYPALNDMRIGGRMNNPAGQYFDGRIADVRVWNVARSQAEIAGAMNTTLTGSEAGLAGYWVLDENTGPSAIDRTANGNHGTLASGAAWAGYRVAEDGVLTAAAAEGVLANDRDGDGDAVNAILDTGPAHGSLALSADGSFSYTPDAHWSGTDSFTYRANDGTSSSNVATVFIVVDPVDDPPVLVTNNPLTVPEEGARTITSAYLQATDADHSATQIAYTVTQTSGSGSSLRLNGVSLGPGGTFTQDDIDNNRVNFGFSDDSFATSFKFTVSDGVATLPEAIFSINGEPVNDTPVNTLPTTFTEAEDTPALLGGISIADVDAASGLVASRLQVSAGTLNVTLAGATSITAGSNGSGDLTLRGTLADINATLASLTYTGAANANGSGAATLTLTTNDGGNTGAGGALQDVDAAAINITPVNDAPMLDSTPFVTFTPITEDDVSNSGNLVSDLIGSAITDADAGAAEGIAIHALAATNGHLEFSVDDGQTWIDVGAVSNSSALLLRDTDRVRFVPNGNNEGSAGIVYWAWDQTTGVAGTKVDASARGGSTAFSTGAELATVSATGVSDAPAITSNGGGSTADTAVAENTTYVTTVAATDVDVPAQTLTYSIVGGGDAGRFTIDGATGALSFAVPPSYENPQGSLSGGWVYEVTVQVSDGVATDTQTLRVIVYNVNDAPVITSNGGGDTAAVSVAENTLAVTTVIASDEDFGAPASTYSIVGGDDSARFDIDSSTGALSFVAAPDFESPDDANNDKAYEVLVQASDGNGGTDIQAITITTTNVNEAPTTSPVTLAPIAEDSGPRLITQAELLANASDVDGPSLTATGLAIASGNGTLVDNGSGTWTYTPAANDDTGVSFSYTVSDGTATVAASATLDVTPVNDAPTFAIGTGKGVTAVTPLGDNGYAVTVQPDGKLLVAGMAAGTNWDFAVVRYNADGTLDTSFGTGGIVKTDFGGGSDQAYSIALQTDGRIVLAGTSGGNFAVARYNVNGSLDTTFDGDGKLTTDMGSMMDVIYSVAVQADGRIVVGGGGGSGTDVEFALARYNADGSLDTTFDGDGKVTTDILSSADEIRSIVLQADGRIVGAGYANAGADSDFALVRYNTDGSLDVTFDGDGKVTTTIGSGKEYAMSLALQPDGRIVAAGYSSNGVNDDFAVVRYDTNGALDTSFDSDGKVTVAFGSGQDRGYGVVVQPNGNIVVAGETHNGSNFDFAVARLNTDGSLDTSFDGDGRVTSAVGTSNDTARGVAFQPDGRIVVGGMSTTGSANDFAIARYTPDGSLDTQFRVANTLDGAPTYTEGGAAVVLDGNVGIFDQELSAAGSYAGATLTLARHGGASAQDLFAATGNLGALTEGSSLVLSGVTIGTVATNSAGTLVLTFSGNATEARVTETLRAVAYQNSSDAPPISVQINWTFSDGNTGAQGSGGALAATGSTTVSITPVNDAPTATITPPGYAATEQVALALHGTGLAIADVDAGSATVRATVSVDYGTVSAVAGTTGVTIAGSGTATVTLTGTIVQINGLLAGSAGGTITYTANTDAPPAGTTLTLTTSDQGNTGSGGQLAGSDTATINITAVNDAPVVTSNGGGATAAVSVAENTTAVTTVTATDADLPAQTLTFSIVGGADAARFTINSSTGGLAFASAPDYEAPADAGANNVYNVRVQVSDGIATGVQDIAVTVTPVNEPPVFTSASLTIGEGQTVTLVGAADFDFADPDNFAFTYTVSGVTGGHFQLSTAPGTPITSFSSLQFGTGQVQFVDDGDEVAPAFSIRVSDGAFDSNTVAATVNFTAVNDAPTTSPVTLTEIAEDSGARLITQAELLANATDIDGPSLSATNLAISSGAGTLVDNGNATWTFTPALNDDTSVSFTYAVTDGSLSVAGSATLDITPVNDAPVATADSYTTAEDTALTATLGVDDLLRNDSDLDGDTLTVNTTPVVDAGHGTLLLNADGTFTYTPDTDYTGADSFTYQVGDGHGGTAQATVTITVTTANDPPTTTGLADVSVEEDAPNTVIDLFAAFADTDDADASLTYTIIANSNPGLFSATTVNGAAGTLTLDYAPNAHGTADLTVRATDSGGLWVESTFAVTVNPVNDTPTTIPVTLTAIAEDSGARLITQGELLARASDVDGPSLTATNLAISSGNGTLVDNGDGTWSYTPAANDDTSVSFTYTVTDGSLNAAGAASLDITPVNDVPSTTSVTLAPIAENSGARLITQAELLANATDIDGPSLSATGLAISSGNGTLVDNGNGTWTYTPAANDDTPVSFGYTVTDGSLSAAGSATLDITPVNDAPLLATIGNRTINEGGTLNFTATATDVDVPANVLTYNLSGAPAGATINATTGAFSWTPTEAQGPGSYSFVIVVDDGQGGSDSETITVTVYAAGGSNNVPVAMTDAGTTQEDMPVTLDLTGNDTDPDGDRLTVSIVTPAAHGTLSVSGGQVMYTPNADWNGDDGFTYAISDGNGGAASANVSIAVTPVNDAPTMTGASIRLRIGENLGLSTANIGALDIDSVTGSLVYSVTNVSGGRFELAAQPGQAISSFGYGDLYAGNVRFVHDGSAAAPTFQISVSDGTSGSAAIVAQVTFDAQNVGAGGQVPGGTDGSAGSGTRGDNTDAQGPTPMQPADATPAEEAPQPVAIDGGARPASTQPTVSVEQQVLASPATLPPSVQPPPSATVVLVDAGGRTAEIDISQGVSLDEYLLRLVSLKLGESAHGSAGREFDVSASDIDPSSRGEAAVHELSIQTAHMLGISLTVGAVWWALRISGLLASLLATLPAWRHLDPLLILPDEDKRERAWALDEDDEAVRDEAAVSELLAGADAGMRR